MLRGLIITVNCKNRDCGKVDVILDAHYGSWIGRCPKCNQTAFEAKRKYNGDIVKISNL